MTIYWNSNADYMTSEDKAKVESLDDPSQLPVDVSVGYVWGQNMIIWWNIWLHIGADDRLVGWFLV